MKTQRTRAVAVIAVAAGLVLSGCGGGGDDGGKGDGRSSASASPTPTVQADPYLKAPWRLQVVNLLTALRTPETGKYRNWMSDDPEYWTTDFIYTPRDSGDPGWSNRGSDGTSVVYPGKMDPTEKKTFFKALTHDGTVLADTLTVVDAYGEPVTGDGPYKFTFTVKTSDGKQLSGMALGSPATDADHSTIGRITYDSTSATEAASAS
ncbi:hypothetical protein OG562_23130 [Streptomyces sp. NBC_01275]|uniref:hypothetical protein n=1 Tax=Streptomyces sp. NBC_01275 TaxID=2903807 RepID=UPI002257A4D6|nr:hypothetical protein [Streptomyces sp. NBC_01275]MCX4763807.1 hypothetical protein [Streptomyces sp. NBC_01275]